MRGSWRVINGANACVTKWAAAAVFIAGTATAASTAVADEPRFIGEFEALGRDGWKPLVGRFLVLEGRYSSASRGQMRFTGSSLQVALPAGMRPRRGQSVRVRGQLRDDNGRPLLRASSLESIPDAAERLSLARGRLRTDAPDDWLELADQFRKPAEFYEDAALLREVREIERLGLEALVRAAGTDADLIREASEEAERRGFDAVLSLLSHETLRREWDGLREDLPGPEALEQVPLFLDRVTRDLPGAADAGIERRVALEEAYARDPRGTFDRADPEQRLALGRTFYAEVAEAYAAARLRPDGANADRLADELAERLPERPDVAAAYRERAVASALENLEALTEGEAVELAARLKREADPRAGSVLPDWLATQRPAAESRGPAALLQLGLDYERLVRDEETAAGLFQRAYEIDNRMTAAASALIERGYELVGGRWRLKIKPAPVRRDGKTVTEVSVGMSGEEALSVLRTIPEETLRMASVGRVTEVWIYRELGLVLTLHRSPVTGVAIVRRVSELK